MLDPKCCFFNVTSGPVGGINPLYLLVGSSIRIYFFMITIIFCSMQTMIMMW